jgi:hypothetical protein
LALCLLPRYASNLLSGSRTDTRQRWDATLETRRILLKNKGIATIERAPQTPVTAADTDVER